MIYCMSGIIIWAAKETDETIEEIGSGSEGFTCKDSQIKVIKSGVCFCYLMITIPLITDKNSCILLFSRWNHTGVVKHWWSGLLSAWGLFQDTGLYWDTNSGMWTDHRLDVNTAQQENSSEKWSKEEKWRLSHGADVEVRKTIKHSASQMLPEQGKSLDTFVVHWWSKSVAQPWALELQRLLTSKEFNIWKRRGSKLSDERRTIRID